MFDIGFWELVVIVVVGMLVLGPERLPSALRSVQRGIAKVKQYSQRVQDELDHELRIKELHEHLKKAEQGSLDDLSPELQRSLTELQDAAAQVQRPYANTENNGKPADTPSASAENPPKKDDNA